MFRALCNFLKINEYVLMLDLPIGGSIKSELFSLIFATSRSRYTANMYGINCSRSFGVQPILRGNSRPSTPLSVWNSHKKFNNQNLIWYMCTCSFYQNKNYYLTCNQHNPNDLFLCVFPLVNQYSVVLLWHRVYGVHHQQADSGIFYSF